MAITFIYPITVTPQSSIDYDVDDKENVIIEKKNDTADSLNYIMRDKNGNITELSSEYLEKMKSYITYNGDKIRFKTISTGINCTVTNTHKEWSAVRDKLNLVNGNTGNLQYCIVQNFGTDLDPIVANEIGVKFARKYLADYQCIVSTHINTGYVHNHIEFNATSFVNGKKFDDCLRVIPEIRKISDKLCEEYNLEVLENTRDMNLVKYKDSNGKTKYFEPTERKNKLIEGEFSNKNDYRNTSQYITSEEFKESHLDIIRKDIDRLLPHAQSYEDLLLQMKNVGYDIKDKTKNGEWRKHVSFKDPTWEKYTRDSSLGSDYERENLEKVINANLKQISNEKMVDEIDTVFIDAPKSEIYVFGKIIIDDIDEEYRYKKKKQEYHKTRRSEIEKIIIRDTKKTNKEIDSIVKRSMYIKHERVQELASRDKRKQYLIDRINNNLKTLKFVEDKEIKSFNQINDIVTSLYEKRNNAYYQLDSIAKALKKANSNLELIKKYSELEHRIEINSSNSDYKSYEKGSDIALLDSYKSLLKQRNLLDVESQEIYREKFNKFNASFKELSRALERINIQIKEYDDCVYNIGRVDKENEQKHIVDIKLYYDTKENNKPKNEKER